MSYRFMRVFVFFDLPVLTAEERREYRIFRKQLLAEGFMMLQESVYCKLALNMVVAGRIMESVRKYKPQKGNICMMVITEKQYARMEYVLGECTSELVCSDERLVIL